jgi:hypothetical protein
MELKFRVCMGGGAIQQAEGRAVTFKHVRERSGFSKGGMIFLIS